MGEVIGLGMTHYPLLLGPDETMAALLHSTLKDPDIPEAEKDPVNWSEFAREEWSDDGGTAAAAKHRAELRTHLERVRAELDAFKPDVVLVWGDDQYENFREEVIPSFCVLAYEDTEVDPFGVITKLGLPNAWGLPNTQSFTMKGAPDFGKQVATAVLDSGVDIAYSYMPRPGTNFPHAFANTQIFLDYDNVGKEFPYPILPIAVNCYGEHVIARCYELGRAVGRMARASDLRVALVASSSWSHAFLYDEGWHLRPDTESDRKLYDAMMADDHEPWIERTSQEVVHSGQHEILNWHCLLGAARELGMELEWSEFVETEIFNSNKAFAVFK